MKNREQLKSINWGIFIVAVLTAVITAISTIFELSAPILTDTRDGEQSRLEFCWGSIHSFILTAIIIISCLLVPAWNRLFPYNMPIMIILLGFVYALFFLTFTVGWVGVQGMLGFIIAFLLGIFLIITYSILDLNQRRKTKIKG
jgi:hypothetical protein